MCRLGKGRGRLQSDQATTGKAGAAALLPDSNARQSAVFNVRPEFGIGVHVFDQKVADNLKRANIRFVRQTMYWYAVEKTTEPGSYDAAALKAWDRLVELYQKNGLIPEVVVHGNAPGCCFATRIDSYQRFARFMAFVAKRYPYVRYWELWNEMDVAFTDLFGAGVKPEVPLRERGKFYTEMLKLAYPAIKQANPKAVVLTGGLTDWGEFPRGIYEAGGRDYFDVMNIHTYGIPLPWSFVQRGAAVRAIMNRSGDATKPLWNTEFGLDAGSIVAAWGMPKTADDVGAAFDKYQKDMISDCLEFNRKAGLYQKCLAYQYAAGNEGMADRTKKAKPKFPPGMELDDYGFGFVRRDGVTPKPIFQYLIDAKVNDAARLAKPVTTEVKLAGKAVTMKLNSDYPTEVAVPAGKERGKEGKNFGSSEK